MIKLVFTDMVSENWQLSTRATIIPNVGDIVSLFVEGEGRVIFVKHFYDENNTQDFVEVILDWKV